MAMLLTPFDLNLRHLRALGAIIAHGSMSKAAHAVGLSQPALTQGLAKLERRLGVALFDRHADGVRPTAAGHALNGRVEAAFGHLADGVRATRRGAARGFARPDLLMTATQLHAFLALADAGSFTAAAEATGITQPALHRAVRDLEQLCGVALAERSGRGLVVTPFGRGLARAIRLAAAEMAAAIGALSPALAVAERIAIGAMPLSRASLLPRAVAALIREETRAILDVREGSWRELVEPLRDGTLDLIVGALRDPAPAGLAQELLFEDELVVVSRPEHPLADGATPSLDQLRRYGWIIGRPDTPLRRHWERLFQGGVMPAAAIECGSVMVIRGVLRETDLLTLLSADQVALELAAGALCRIGGVRAGKRAIGVATRAGWRPTKAQERFLQLLRDAASSHRLHESQ